MSKLAKFCKIYQKNDKTKLTKFDRIGKVYTKLPKFMKSNIKIGKVNTL